MVSSTRLKWLRFKLMVLIRTIRIRRISQQYAVPLPYAVVTDDDDRVVGRFPTLADAQTMLFALHVTDSPILGAIYRKGRFITSRCGQCEACEQELASFYADLADELELD